MENTNKPFNPLMQQFDGVQAMESYASCNEKNSFTLRDYFAGQCISNQVWEAYDHSEEIAKRAYQLADAMLKQREL